MYVVCEHVCVLACARRVTVVGNYIPCPAVNPKHAWCVCFLCMRASCVRECVCSGFFPSENWWSKFICPVLFDCICDIVNFKSNIELSLFLKSSLISKKYFENKGSTYVMCNIDKYVWETKKCFENMIFSKPTLIYWWKR